MPPILWKVDPSPPARTAMMVADLLGLKLELRDLNPLARDQDSPEFFKKNPMRTVPILDYGDFSLADSHAIAIHFVEKYGRPEHEYLYPKEERTRATVNQRLFFDCGILFPRLRDIMSPTYSGRLTELTRYNKLMLEDAYKTLEAYLSDSVYLACGHITIADLSAFTTMSTLNGLYPVDEKRYPKTKKWMKTMSEKDVSKRINEEGANIHLMHLLAKMDLNKERLLEKERKSKL